MSSDITATGPISIFNTKNGVLKDKLIKENGHIPISIWQSTPVEREEPTDSNILGGCKEAVNQNPHKRGVQTILNREVSDLGVTHSLRNYDGTDCNPGNEITEEPCQVVAGNPCSDGEQRYDVVPCVSGKLLAEVLKSLLV